MYSSSLVKVGKLWLGGNSSVRIQSMTNTNTLDTVATVNQIVELVNAGCDLVRITTQNIKEAENISNIKLKLQEKGIDIPIVADVHFNPKVAEIAALYVEKVRINPGNYYSSSNSDDEKEAISENLIPLLEVCKENNTAIRIGVNHGSLSKRILFDYGNTPLGMVESLMEFIEVCINEGFDNLVLSLKASNVKTMIEANLLLVERMKAKNLSYPIHLGVTEAGSDDEGRIKSAAGIGYLLAYGIGDTIRVSLTENPVKEIPIAKILVGLFGAKQNVSNNIFGTNLRFRSINYVGNKPVVVTSNKSKYSDIIANELIKQNDLLANDNSLLISTFSYDELSYEEIIIKATVEITLSLLKTQIDGIFIKPSRSLSNDQSAKLVLGILQVLGLRTSSSEYIACPTCGRTTLDLISLLNEIKEKTKHLVGLKIAIMGCIVNGPGEMVDAHYGIIGAGSNSVRLYKDGVLIQRSVPKEIAVDSIIELIKQNNDWIDA